MCHIQAGQSESQVYGNFTPQRRENYPSGEIEASPNAAEDMNRGFINGVLNTKIDAIPR